MSESKWASRKLWTCILGMSFAAGLRLRGIVLDEGTVTVLVVGMVGYCGTNVWQKRVERNPLPAGSAGTQSGVMQ